MSTKTKQEEKRKPAKYKIGTKVVFREEAECKIKNTHYSEDEKRYVCAFMGYELVNVHVDLLRAVKKNKK